MKKAPLLKNDSGLNILLEFIFSFAIVILLFTIMMLIVGNITSSSDSIVLKEEYDIIANDVANRISAFASEASLNDQKGYYDSSVINFKDTYFDLPVPIKGKQYNIDITQDLNHKGTVKVSYVSNDQIYATATFYSEITVTHSNFNSMYTKYKISYNYNGGNPFILVENYV